jgi:hypothetical protein
MRNKRTLRYGLAAVVLSGAALGGTLAACGDDDNAVTVRPDGSVPPPTDSGGTDARTEAGPTPTPAKIQIVNAATDLGPGSDVNLAGNPLRACYGVGTTEANAQVASLSPLPDTATGTQPFPGVFAGTGGPVPSSGIDLSGLVLVPYILNAAKLQALTAAGTIQGRDGGVPGTSCRDIFVGDAGGALTEGVDYWKLPSIPAGVLLSGKSFILLLTGCSGNATQPAAKCGPGFTSSTPNGNLKATVYELDKTSAVGPDKLGAQFIHASAPALALISDAGFVPGFVVGDAGLSLDAGYRPISNNQVVPFLNSITAVSQNTVDLANDNFAVYPDGGPVSFNFPTIKATSVGLEAGSPYKNGAAFTFIALGDPARGPDVKTAEFFHVIALPNDPVIVSAQ